MKIEPFYNRSNPIPETPLTEDEKEKIQNHYDRLVSQLRDLETPKYRIIERLEKLSPPGFIETEQSVFERNIIERHIQELKGETPAKEHKYNRKELFYLLHKLGIIEHLHEKGVERGNKGYEKIAKIVEAITGRDLSPSTVKSYLSEILNSNIPKTTETKMYDVYTELME